MKFIIYDPDSGEITGRISCSSRQETLYPVKRAVTQREYEDKPELFQKVDVSNAKAPMVALTVEEARSKGASEEFISEKISSGKLPPSKEDRK